MELDLSNCHMPHRYDANIVEGMMENPLLTGVLEQMVSSPSLASVVRPMEPWYQDANFSIVGMAPTVVEIRDVMACSLNQAKLIMAHFPTASLRVVVLGDPQMRHLMMRLHTLARCTERPFVVEMTRQDGLQLIGKFSGGRLGVKISAQK